MKRYIVSIEPTAFDAEDEEHAIEQFLNYHGLEVSNEQALDALVEEESEVIDTPHG